MLRVHSRSPNLRRSGVAAKALVLAGVLSKAVADAAPGAGEPAGDSQPGAFLGGSTRTLSSSTAWHSIVGPCQVRQDGCLESPGYPLAYGNDEQCELMPDSGFWADKVMNVVFFQTEGCCDKLEVNGIAYSGHDGPAGIKPSSMVYWSSDDQLPRNGFRICPEEEAIQGSVTFEAEDSASEGGGGGAIVGAIVGAVAVLGICGGLAAFAFRKYRANMAENERKEKEKAKVHQAAPGMPMGFAIPPGGVPMMMPPPASPPPAADTGDVAVVAPAAGAAVTQPGSGGDARHPSKDTAAAKAAPKAKPAAAPAPTPAASPAAAPAAAPVPAAAPAPAGGTEDGGSRKQTIQPHRTPDIAVPDEDGRPPPYWKNRDVHSGFDELIPASQAEMHAIQNLLESTFKSIKTRDRKGGKVPKALRMQSLQRVENSKLWEKFTEGRYFLKQKRDHKCTPIRQYGGDILTERGLPVDRSALLKRVNETFFWHGTSPHAAKSIIAGGFRLDHSGSNAGTMYGRGAYFAECSSKSDEYSTDDNGLFCLLLCRVALGELLHMTAGGESTYSMIKSAIEEGAYDSVLGDREASVGTYREFVVYGEDQVYPEYLVIYKREYD